MDIKKSYIDIVLILLILSLIIVVVILIVKFDRDGFNCLANPVFYYEKLENKNCKCYDTDDVRSLEVNLSFLNQSESSEVSPSSS